MVKQQSLSAPDPALKMPEEVCQATEERVPQVKGKWPANLKEGYVLDV